jgi:Cytochrome c oxidase subunit IV
MKVESFYWLGITAFFIVLGAVYWFTSYEDAGTTMLVATSLLGLLAGGYLFLQSRRYPPRAQDRPDATLEEGAGPVDEFPAPSIWPFVFGLGATVFATGFIFGIWVILPGAAILGLGIVGMILQSRGRTAPVPDEHSRRRAAAGE